MKNLLYMFIVSISLSQDEFFITIPATSYSEWIYFSFNSNDIIEIDNPETSLEWDLAFQRKHIKTNSGLSGAGGGGGYVDSTLTWFDQWSQMTELPQNISWHADETFNDFYDLSTHTFIEGTKNRALNSWGWFDEAYQLNPTNYVMFVRCANGEDIIKFWAYNFYENGLGGNVSIRYENGFCRGILHSTPNPVRKTQSSSNSRRESRIRNESGGARNCHCCSTLTCYLD